MPESEPVAAPSRALRPRRGAQVFAAVGVLAAAALAVNANLLVARFYQRWDLTSEQLYTLAPATRETLSNLNTRIDIIVLLSRGDPSLVSVRHTLLAYSAETQKLDVKYLDPEQHPAEFLALQRQYGLIAGKAEDGRVVADASIIVANGERHWFITTEDMLGFDAESGNVRPRLEQALTSAIVNVLGVEKAKVCFSRGHQELSLNDNGPEGLSELRDRIEKSNYAAEERDLIGTAKGSPLADCRLLVVAAPRLAFEPSAADALGEAIKGGMSALFLLPPVLAEKGGIEATGLESVLSLADVELGRHFVIETDDAARLPRGLGEVFFAVPKPHAVTQGLLKGGAKLELRVLLSGAQNLRLTSAEPKPILASSEQALALSDVAALTDGRLDQDSPRGLQILGAARELPKPNGAEHAPRLVVVGAGNPAHNRSFRDSGLYGDRILIENSVSWLAARPALISVPEKPAHEVGLSLSEESLVEVLRYVLIYMPGSAALVGLAIVLRRRMVEKRSRKAARTSPETR
jgi:hypothetical protein